MATATKRDLMLAAAKARRRAVAPYSRFKVGAALLTKAGEIVTGANVESASFGLTCCAERVALFNALTGGKTSLVGLAIVARSPGGPMPCGACRQLLATIWGSENDSTPQQFLLQWERASAATVPLKFRAEGGAAAAYLALVCCFSRDEQKYFVLQLLPENAAAAPVKVQTGETSLAQ